MDNFSSPKFSSAAITDRGLSDKRPQNEDSFLELADIGLFAVADGVGGAQAGDVASQMAVEVLAEAFRHRPSTADTEIVLRTAVERANEAIFQTASELPQLHSMATTIVALQLSDNIATIGHVGDSRLYRIDPMGRLFRETVDHSVVEEEVRAGRITPEQALTHPGRNVISRALGAEQTVSIDLKTMMVDPGTLFLLCSDGITRHISDQELKEIFGADLDPAALTDRLKQICFSRGAEDNLTAVVVRVSPQMENGTLPIVGVTAEETVNADSGADEDTVATARSPYDNERAEPVESFENIESSYSESLDFAEETDLDDESYLSDELTEQTDKSSDAAYVSSRLPVPVSSERIAASQRTGPMVLETHAASRQRLGISSITVALAALLIGGIVGAAIYGTYFLPDPQIQQQPAIVEKSPDVSLTSFEQSRRLIDTDPAGYIKANAASPQNAEDYFLLGRAFLLTGRNWEAARAFSESRNRLAEADPKNARTLAAEIAMASAIIATPGAAEAFAKNVALAPNSNSGAAPANAAAPGAGLSRP